MTASRSRVRAMRSALAFAALALILFLLGFFAVRYSAPIAETPTPQEVSNSPSIPSDAPERGPRRARSGNLTVGSPTPSAVSDASGPGDGEWELIVRVVSDADELAPEFDVVLSGGRRVDWRSVGAAGRAAPTQDSVARLTGNGSWFGCVVARNKSAMAVSDSLWLFPGDSVEVTLTVECDEKSLVGEVYPPISDGIAVLTPRPSSVAHSAHFVAPVAAGRFVFPWVPRDLRRDGAILRVVRHGNVLGRFDVSPTEVAGGVIVRSLGQGRRVLGQVADREGRGIAGAHVASSLTMSVAITDVDGRFELGPVGPGELQVLVRAHGFAERLIECASNSDVDLGEIRLGSGSPIAGRVMDRAGSPIEGAVVVRSIGAIQVGATRTDSAGRFVFPQCSDEPNELIVRPGQVSYEDSPPILRVPGVRPSDSEVVVRVGDETCLSFRLVDSAGQPVHARAVAIELTPMSAPSDARVERRSGGTFSGVCVSVAPERSYTGAIAVHGYEPVPFGPVRVPGGEIRSLEVELAPLSTLVTRRRGE